MHDNIIKNLGDIFSNKDWIKKGTGEKEISFMIGERKRNGYDCKKQMAYYYMKAVQKEEKNGGRERKMNAQN